MKMFPNKLPSKITQYAQSLEILSADESTEIHVEFCWPRAVSFPIKVMVVLFLNDMMLCFAFQGVLLALERRSSECILRFVITDIRLKISFNFFGLKSSVKDLIAKELKINFRSSIYFW